MMGLRESHSHSSRRYSGLPTVNQNPGNHCQILARWYVLKAVRHSQTGPNSQCPSSLTSTRGVFPSKSHLFPCRESGDADKGFEEFSAHRDLGLDWVLTCSRVSTCRRQSFNVYRDPDARGTCSGISVALNRIPQELVRAIFGQLGIDP
jgi:hypothetical protein